MIHFSHWPLSVTPANLLVYSKAAKSLTNIAIETVYSFAIDFVNKFIIHKRTDYDTNCDFLQEKGVLLTRNITWVFFTCTFYDCVWRNSEGDDKIVPCQLMMHSVQKLYYTVYFFSWSYTSESQTAYNKAQRGENQENCMFFSLYERVPSNKFWIKCFAAYWSCQISMTEQSA